MTSPRLASLEDVADVAMRPAYDPARIKTGIVHLGTGAFHKAHLAAYTDMALARDGGDWRIIGASLRGPDAAEALNPQNGLYTLIERSAEGTRARIVASIQSVIAAADDRERLIAAMSVPAIRIVSLTVTEKAYGIRRDSGKLNPDHPGIASDLAAPQRPGSPVGLIVEVLRRRRAAKIAPFTVLCCDNLPENGALLGSGVRDFAARLDPSLAQWITETVSFPCTMVDRITPGPTENTRREAERRTGCRDLAAVETEAFSQWVIEDDFPSGRPKWEAGGALFVEDVRPYEAMKLRMLNGAHSMLAYSGFLSRKTHVRDVMQHKALAMLVARHLAAASRTLDPLDGIDLDAYAAALVQRFRNPSIAHETYQIAMDGTEKLPQRMFAPALVAIARGQEIGAFAFAVACWMRFAAGRHDDGTPYALRDPREAEISELLGETCDAEGIYDRVSGLPDFMPRPLATAEGWRAAVIGPLAVMLEHGMAAAIDAEARRCA